MLRSLFTTVIIGSQKDPQSHPEALSSKAWTDSSTAAGAFASELEKLALELDDPDLQTLLTSSAVRAQSLLNNYSQRPSHTADSSRSRLGGFSALANETQKFIVTYKTPLLSTGGPSLGGQSVDASRPTNDVTGVASSLSRGTETASRQEVMSALGVVVRETVITRVKLAAKEKLGGQSLAQLHDPYAYASSFMSHPRRRYLAADESEPFESDFMVTLHMDIIECDIKKENPMFSTVQDYYNRNNPNARLLSERCVDLMDIFNSDNLVDNVHMEEELFGAQELISTADSRSLQARIDAIQMTASRGFPDDPLLPQQWLHESPTAGVNSRAMWNDWKTRPPAPVQTNAPPVLVALIDSGIDYLHEDLVGSVWENPGEVCNDGIDNDGNGFIDDCYGWNFVDNSNDPMDDNGHGTAAAGIIAASPNNRYGITPVCWNCILVPIKALDKNIKGTVSGFVKGLNYALLAGAKISNNSYGGQGSRFGSLEDAVRRAEIQGMVFVAASGNFSCDADVEPAFPASYDIPNVVSVASHNSDAQISDFSCFGRSSVHLSAPGEKVLTLARNNGFSRVNGTSFAAPVVTGILAMVLNENRSLNYLQIIDVLYSTVNRLPQLQGRVITGGIPDARAALFRAREMLRLTPVSETPEDISETTQSSATDVVICLHDLCPHKALCLEAEKHKFSINQPQLDPNKSYSDDVMACRCADGYELVKNATPPDFPWAGNIGYCRDVNECAAENQCGEKSELDKYRIGCFNVEGGFECRCKQGFTSVPQSDPGVRCVDVNECQLSARLCPPESWCLNLPGNHECICRDSRLYWDSVSNACRSINAMTQVQCKDSRTEVWAIDKCLCRVGYARNETTSWTCVRAGVLEAVAVSIYQGVVSDSYNKNQRL
eukprot:GHVH01000825.1.p1 GENE.GHVH01000825.1~~GHVH01000825.1.p1  ORF type:complete len:889 (+),score=131.62 GHVH01000825.1:233-2899(+)